MSELEEFVRPIKGFATRPAPAQIEAFAWYLHEVKRAERITTAMLAQCFDEAHVVKPANIASSLSKLCDRKPPRFIRDKAGYRLSTSARQELGELLPVRATAVKATRVLRDLLPKVNNAAQRVFLEEALVCFGVGAYRAAVVMTWNLVFSDFLDRIFASGLQQFNGQIGTHNFRRAIQTRQDFADLKESDIIKICRTARLISGETLKTLDEKLGKRNTAAHPSSVIVGTATAEEVIFDLVENVMLKAAL